jgi:hypothetical protein
MAYIARRAARINGMDYVAGDVVPTAGLRNLRSLVAARYLEAEPDPAPDLVQLTREELNAQAAARGIAGAAELPNKAAVIAAIEGTA